MARIANGTKRSVIFEEDVDEIIERHRRNFSPIPTITWAVNDLIRSTERSGKDAT